MRAGTGPPPAPGSPRARRVGLVVGPLLFLALLLWPGVPLDGPQRRVAATTALTATWWITAAIPIGATSLLPAVLFPLLSVMPAGEAAPLYMRDLVFLFLGAFIVALGLERWDVHRRMALWIIARVGTGRRNLVLGFMAAAAFLSLWINNTATTLLMLPIGTAVIASVRGDGARGDGESRGDGRFGVALLLGIAWSASVGGMGTPVGTAPNQEFLGQFADRFPDGPSISFGDWFVGWLPLVLLFVPICWLLLTRVLLPIPAGGLAGGDVIRREREALGPWTRGQLLMASVFAATALLWVTRADLDLGFVRVPGWSRLFLPAAAADPTWYAAHKNDVSDSTVATAMALLCFLLPAARGERGRRVFLVDWDTARRVPWDVLLLLGGGFCLARGFKVSGLDVVLGGSVAPLIEGRASWVVVAVVALVMSLLTELTSNTATTAVLLPVLATAATASGANPLLVMAPATIAASAAFMLPIATPPNAVVFSSGCVPPTTMARTGLWVNLLMVVLVTLVFELWVRRVWGIAPELPDWAGG